MPISPPIEPKLLPVSTLVDVRESMIYESAEEDTHAYSSIAAVTS